MRINNPVQTPIQAHLNLFYTGKNSYYLQKRYLTKTIIKEADYNLDEELLIELKTFDNTEIMVSMISGNLYMKIDGKYKFLEIGEEEKQNFVHFELFIDDTEEFMIFHGWLSYHKDFGDNHSYIEPFRISVIMKRDQKVFDIWSGKHKKDVLYPWISMPKPPETGFDAYMSLWYLGENHCHVFGKTFPKIHIEEINSDLNEELLIQLRMYDGTEIMISMISANLYIKVNEKYELQEKDFCDFELFMTDELMVFHGKISYRKNFETEYSFREHYRTSIIIDRNERLLDIWKKHDKRIV